MCTRGDSKAAKRARQATRPPVPTSGSEASARSRASNALSVPIVGSFQSPTTSYAGTCQVTTPRASPSSPASTPCCRTRPASSLPSISTRPAGATMPRRFLKPVGTSISQPRSNDHAPGEARMCGSSSKRPFRPHLPDDWDRTFSPRRWKGVRTSASIRTTGCFLTKTRCRKEDLET